MFKVIKQGDAYRILYSAKNFTTGLSDVQAVPYNPSGTAQTAVALSEMGTSGVYYADYDTTGKTIGTWGFKINSATKPAPAIDKIQIVDGDTLNDTLLEKLDTMLDSALSNQSTMDGKLDTIVSQTDTLEGSLATQDGKIDIIDQNVDDIEAIVSSVTFGNSALKDLIDTLQSTVSGLSNNSDAKIAMVDSMLIPGSGSNTYKFFFRFYDADGNMEDPDDQDAGAEEAMVSVSVANSAGTDRSGNLGGLGASTQDSKDWMTHVSTGVFSATYVVDAGDSVEDLIFSFDCLENSNAKSFAAIARTAGAESDYTSRFNTIDTNLATANGNINDIETIVASASFGNSALKDLIDAIQADIDDGTNGLAAIKAAIIANYDELTDASTGLAALKAILDTINTNTNGVETDLTAIKGSGWVAADNLHNIADDVKPGGIAV